jgi:hypothetical protein
MKILTTHFLCAILLLLISNPLFSASIMLKNNKSIEGRIIVEGEETVIVKEFRTNREYRLKRDEIAIIIYDEQERREQAEKKREQEEAEKEPFVKRYQPRFGILPGLTIPTGDIGSVLGMGFGGRVFCDFLLPFLNTPGSKYMVRTGLFVGYGSFSSTDPEIDATVTILPVIIYAEGSYLSESGFRPYAHLGLGITMASLQKKTEDESISESSSDGTLSVGLGCGYTFNSIPRIEFLVDLNYMIVFEEVSGHFASISIGAAYRFHIPEE